MTFECEWNWRFRSYIFASKCPKILWKRLIIIIWTWKHEQIHFILTMASDIVTSAPSQLHKIYTKILHPRKLNNIQVTQANTNIGKRKTKKTNKNTTCYIYIHSLVWMNSPIDVVFKTVIRRKHYDCIHTNGQWEKHLCCGCIPNLSWKNVYLCK